MSFIPAAEAALDGRPHEGLADHVEIDVVEREPPPVFDAEGLRALVAPFFAAFLWAAARFREMTSAQPIDAIALLLQVLALGLTLRALLGLALIVRRLRARVALARYGLALADEGFLYRSPLGDVVVMREDVLDVRERGDWRGKAGRRWAEVFVSTRAESGRSFVALPPVFMRTPGMLAERLMRWRAAAPGGMSPAVITTDVAPDELSSKLWDRLAGGERPRGITVIGHGRAWLAHGPYASVLVGLVMLAAYLRSSAPMRAAIGMKGPAILALILVIVPLWWITTRRASFAAHRGIALVLTPRELLFRTRSGVNRVAWSTVARVEVAARTRWSILRGAQELRTLILHRKQVEDIYYAEALLEVPAEVAAGLCDGYRKAALTAVGSDADHGDSAVAEFD